MGTRCFRLAACSFAAALQFAAHATHAQQPVETQRVDITGQVPSSIGGPPAGPVTVLRAADLARLGVGTAAQALQVLASHQATKGVAQAVGEASGGAAEADLRGLGEEKTLVLLDGRRLAAHAYHGAAVDLNAIPLAAIDRIEIRRDAGVVLHGSGAIAGVVDFILRRDVDGLSLTAETERPQQRGGASARANVVGGRGVLARDGFAWVAAADVRQQQAIAARQRRFTSSGIVRDANGAVVHAVTSATSFPGDLDGFEPSLAAGCAPPRSVSDPHGGASCRYDELPDVDLVPRNRQATLLADAAWAGPAATTWRAQWLWAEQRVRSTTSPTPVTALLPQSSRYWIAGRPARGFDDVPGSPLGGIADFRLVSEGRRVDESRSVAQRALLTAESKLASWEIDAALLHSTSRVADRLVAGHVDLERVQQGLLDGAIDPFGAPDAAGRAALDAAALRGPLVSARSALSSLELRAARRFGAADAPMQHRVLLLAQAAHERFDFDVHPNAALAAANELEQATDTRGTRTSQALAGSWTVTFGRYVDATLGARVDRIDPGTPAAGPPEGGRAPSAGGERSERGGHIRSSASLGLRWRMSPALQWRASIGNGFRAATLYESHAPAHLVRSQAAFDDPLLCPDGAALAGVPASAACGVQPLLRAGGPASAGRSPSSLEPETGRIATLGFAAAPTARTTLSADLWWARLRHGIDALSADVVFDDPQRWGARLVRCGSLDATTRATVDDCAAWPAVDPIAWVLVPNENLVDTDARGVDVALAWRSGVGALGELALSLDASWTARHRTRVGADAAFVDSVGRFALDRPVFRLQTSTQATWTRGPWTATLAQRRRSGYVDQSGEHRVRAYALVDAALAYSAASGLTVGVGVKNVFDRDPPFSDQTQMRQTNYDPRFTDPTGRALTLRLAWEWR